MSLLKPKRERDWRLYYREGKTLVINVDIIVFCAVIAVALVEIWRAL